MEANACCSSCSKLVQKEYKTRHDRVEKLIQEEQCEKLKLEHMKKWYMHKPHEDFEIHIDQLISDRRPDLEIVNNNNKKENLPYSGLCRSGRLQSKMKGKGKER